MQVGFGSDSQPGENDRNSSKQGIRGHLSFTTFTPMRKGHIVQVVAQAPAHALSSMLTRKGKLYGDLPVIPAKAGRCPRILVIAA
jgi:hypothetical protein